MRYFRASDIFGSKVYFKGCRARGHFFLPNEFQKCQNPSDWPEKYVSGKSTRRSRQVILSPFYTKWFSLSIEREDSHEEFSKKNGLRKPRKSQTVTWELAILFHQFSWRIYRRYIVKLTSVVFFLKIKINSYSKSTRFLYCYFWLRRKLVENTSLRLLIISPRSLHNFTICKSLLHGPRNYVDRTWERSAKGPTI